MWAIWEIPENPKFESLNVFTNHKEILYFFFNFKKVLTKLAENPFHDAKQALELKTESSTRPTTQFRVNSNRTEHKLCERVHSFLPDNAAGIYML